MYRIALGLAAAGLLFAQADWNEPYPPHKVIGNVYYVGSKGLSTYLITTKAGHFLINSSFERTVPIIRANVEKLGFKMTDVKYLLASHAHGDHVEGHALLKELTGAQILVMKGDEGVIEAGGKGQYKYPDTWKPVKVNRVLKDGEKVVLGGVELTAVLTPGHTRGCTTWTLVAEEGGKKYNVVIVGSPNVNPGYELVGNKVYPEIAKDFAHTFQVLQALKCDVFLGAHGAYYGMEAKVAKMGKGANPFIDPQGYKAYIGEREAYFRKVLAEQSK